MEMQNFGVSNKTGMSWIGPRERIFLMSMPSSQNSEYPMHLQVDLYTPKSDALDDWDDDEWESQKVYVDFMPHAFKEAYSLARLVLRNHGLWAGAEV